MSKSLYNKEIPASCCYCVNASVSSTLNSVFCKYKGPVLGTDYCRKYIYDPLKRVPKAKAPLPKFTKEDFEL